MDYVWPLQNNTVDVGLMLGAAVITPTTLLGILYYEVHHLAVAPATAFRDSIASAFVVLYLTIVSWATFFNLRTDNLNLAPLTRDIVSNFGTLTGVVVAFYFGSNTVASIFNTKTLAGSKNATDGDAGHDSTPSKSTQDT